MTCSKPAPPMWRGRRGQSLLVCIRAKDHADHPLLFTGTGRPRALAQEQHVTADGRIWPYKKVNAEYA